MALPTKILLYPPGETSSRHGLSFVVDQITIDQWNEFKQNVDSKDIIPIIIEHGMTGHGTQAVGKGQINADLQEGLVLKNITWNEDGQKLVENEFWLYTSPGMQARPVIDAEGEMTFTENGLLKMRPVCVDEVSLTNTPATNNMKTLMSVKQSAGNLNVSVKLTDSIQLEESMKNKIINQADGADVEPEDKKDGEDPMETLKKENEELRLQLAEMKDKLSAYEKEQSEKESASLIQSLKDDGRIGDAVAELLKSFKLDDLKKYAESCLKDPKPVAVNDAAREKALGEKPINQSTAGKGAPTLFKSINQFQKAKGNK